MAPHVVIFPFMSTCRTVPLLHLGRLLLQRGLSVTILTTPLNAPSIRQALMDTDTSIIDIPFRHNIPQLAGIESIDNLPCMSLFLPFANATKLMQPHFDRLIQTLPKVTCIISDGFLWWTQQSASKLGIPRYIFYGISNYAGAIYQLIVRDSLQASANSDDEPFSVPDFPWIKLTKNDLEPPFKDPEPKGPPFEFIMSQVITNSQSKGYIVNTFYDLEPVFTDYCESEFEKKSWCVGPLCLAEPQTPHPKEKPMWIQWLDGKLANGKAVLYVALGSYAEISDGQLKELADGLERSKVDFMWVIQPHDLERLAGYTEKVRDRGLIINELVDQAQILNHGSVSGFMSSCSWSSVLDSICAFVPVLAWPIRADQQLNARMVVEELGIGNRVLARNGSVRGFVGSECLEKMVKELMEGEKGKEVRKKVTEIGELARKAVSEGGSSRRTLDLLIQEMSAEHLGLPYLRAYLDSLGTNFRQGANFATQGSTIQRLNLPLLDGGYSPFSLDFQVSQFEQFRARTSYLYEHAKTKSERKHLPKPEEFSKALYTFDIGQNDLFSWFSEYV